MRAIQTEDRIEIQRTCPKCNKYYQYRDGSPKFCECGQSLEKRVAVKLCPFCGEDLTESHISYSLYSCDGDFTVLLETDDGFIVYDGDFWFAQKWQDYEITKYSLKPIEKQEALEIASGYHDAMISETEAAIQAIQKINEPYKIANEKTGAPFNRRLDQ